MLAFLMQYTKENGKAENEKVRAGKLRKIRGSDSSPSPQNP